MEASGLIYTELSLPRLDIRTAVNHSHLKQSATEESLWMDGSSNTPWSTEELGHKRICIASSLGCGGDRNRNAIQDESADFIDLLKVCAKNRDSSRGIKIHNDILRRGLLQDCANALVIMYVKCGMLEKAEDLLASHTSVDVVSWNALIAGHARNCQGQEALDSFERMQSEGLAPDVVTYACVLKACGAVGALDKGKQIHDQIQKQGLLQNDAVLGTALVHMYAKCGALSEARGVLDDLPSQDVFSWSVLIAGYVQEGQGEQAIDCFECMQQEHILPDAVTYICILKACSAIGAIDKGRQVHDQTVKQGLLPNSVMLATALVDMYAKCGAFPEAQDVLQQLPSRNVVTWSALIAVYAQEGQGRQALSCYECMLYEGITPNAVTYACILQACGTVGDVDDKGKQVHDSIVGRGLLENDIVLGTALVNMYVKCGALLEAQTVLQDLSWNPLIAGYSQQGQAVKAVSCFKFMQSEGLHPDAVTYIYILKACSVLGAADKGKQVHASIVRRGYYQMTVCWVLLL